MMPVLALTNERRTNLKIAEYDIAGSRAHVWPGPTQLLSVAEGASLDNGLAQILTELRTVTFLFPWAMEMCTWHIEERRLASWSARSAASHAARSRNDQVSQMRFTSRRRRKRVDDTALLRLGRWVDAEHADGCRQS